MALYCIGDIQGCSDALERLLAHIGFSPSRDTVYLLGDLVNRGPDSAAVLRRCMRLDGALRPLLGNHDLHLLAAAHGTRRASRRDTLTSVLDAPDRNTLLDWLCQQPLARAHQHAGERLLMVHAGLLPAWSADDTLALAERQIRRSEIQRKKVCFHSVGAKRDRTFFQLRIEFSHRAVQYSKARAHLCNMPRVLLRRRGRDGPVSKAPFHGRAVVVRRGVHHPAQAHDDEDEREQKCREDRPHGISCLFIPRKRGGFPDPICCCNRSCQNIPPRIISFAGKNKRSCLVANKPIGLQIPMI